ncbi:peptidase family C78-domain-containing protein [Pseudomassariella vexata]|uniref:Peptidase family C78-domain-containing protein n=1 Tax=Pseudomassariella vexata TaxID=1141098 RepID=A0A1Y2EKF4_9PEZI|nr:peptidase family C78-domain-containing protein [Pseudomassariella vexata]ORY72031.1 peptidase family C78-domain-containing protein [Pseudomassariella vexata]
MSSETAKSMKCPFCGYSSGEEYAMMLHIETRHAEGKSPFVDETSAATVSEPSPDDEQYVECPIDGCGEVVTLTELDDHIELHAAEENGAITPEDRETPAKDGSRQEYQSPYSQPGNRNTNADSSSSRRKENSTCRRLEETVNDRQGDAIQKWKQIFHMPAVKVPRTESHAGGPAQKKRLGKAELGKYAHEDKMPQSLVDLLRRDGQVTSSDRDLHQVFTGVIPVLEQILDQNSRTAWAYLCHPCVWHVSKLKGEGGFCGYRNIQMMSSFIIGSRSTGATHFRGRLPSIFRIQDYIEHAWDVGINAQGRVETGGVKGTRKYIGTPEAQAMFTVLDIPCEAQGFKDTRPGSAEMKLLRYVQDYFESADFDPRDKVRRTTLPPIYFQHRGHSLTIVGLEKRHDGETELLVFDPMFGDPRTITKYIGRTFEGSTDKALKLYRRGNKYLRKYYEFEVLTYVQLDE